MGLISALLGGSLIYYVYLAVDLYRQDKSAVVYSHTLSQLSGISDSIRSWLINERDFILGVLSSKELNANEKARVLALRDSLQEVVLLSDKKPVKVYQRNSNSFFYREDGQSSDWQEMLKKNFIDNNLGSIQIVEDKTSQSTDEPMESSSLVLWLFPINEWEQVAIALKGTSLNILLKRLKGEDFEKAALVDGQGKVVWGDLPSQSIQNELHQFAQLSGKVIERNNEAGEPFLLAVRSVAGLPLYLFKEVLASQVFAAGELLIKRSLFYGLFILSGSFILGILFSRRLTSNLANLSEATEWISQGIFNRKVVLKGNDEIGALSDSFNLMGDKIEHLLGEVKEKARLENEVAVAKLVQSYFFPDENLTIPPYQLSGSFYPASECGGDWWAMAEYGGKTLMIIADATGHGVPAALLTATAHSALSVPIEMMKKKSLNLDAVGLMELLNTAICSVGANIHMTCWLGILDSESNQLNYTNASHNPPYLFKKKQSELIALMEGQGPRLGESKQSQFNSDTVVLDEGDVLALLTDGLTEIQNSEGKQWGNRRLRKLIETESEQSAQMLKMKMLKEAFSFADGKALDDDITVVILKKQSVVTVAQVGTDSIDTLTKEQRAVEIDGIHFIPFDPVNPKADFGPKDVLLGPMNYTHDQVIEILKNSNLNFLIGQSANLQQEITQTLHALTSGDCLGHLTRVDELLWSKKVKLQNYQEIYKKVDEAMSEIPLDEFFESPIPYLKQIAVELLMNATSYSKNNIVELELALSETGVYLTVRDNLGNLTREQVISKLGRASEEKSPVEVINKTSAGGLPAGAGLGLYLSFCSCNRFQVVSIPNVRTEITCMIEKNKRYKNFKGRTPSFHFFELA